jgi:hypothetical protein
MSKKNIKLFKLNTKTQKSRFKISGFFIYTI